MVRRSISSEGLLPVQLSAYQEQLTDGSSGELPRVPSKVPPRPSFGLVYNSVIPLKDDLSSQLKIPELATDLMRNLIYTNKRDLWQCTSCISKNTEVWIVYGSVVNNITIILHGHNVTTSRGEGRKGVLHNNEHNEWLNGTDDTRRSCY